MIRAIIIEDEQHCINRLTELTGKFLQKEVQLLQSFTSVEAGLKGIVQLQPELVFLDIQIQDQTGFDLLKQIPSRNFEVIFTTAYHQYAIQAFKVSAIDYLLKPIDVADLQHAVQKIMQKKSDTTEQRLSVLLHNLTQEHYATRRISINTTSGFTFVETADILR